jgi:hypothetical protein
MVEKENVEVKKKKLGFLMDVHNQSEKVVEETEEATVEPAPGVNIDILYLKHIYHNYYMY